MLGQSISFPVMVRCCLWRVQFSGCRPHPLQEEYSADLLVHQQSITPVVTLPVRLQERLYDLDLKSSCPLYPAWFPSHPDVVDPANLQGDGINVKSCPVRLVATSPSRYAWCGRYRLKYQDYSGQRQVEAIVIPFHPGAPWTHR